MKKITPYPRPELPVISFYSPQQDL